MSWKSSEEKKILKDDIINGLISGDNDIRLIYDMYDGMYHRFPFDNFKVNFKNLVAAVNKQKQNAVQDRAILANTLMQRPLQAPPDFPPWHSSDARRLLLLDFESGTIANMIPSAIQQVRPEYMVYSKKKFRDNYYKEKYKPVTKAYWDFQKALREEKKDARKQRQNRNNN
jgi:hypothetical protein